jgi:hypothetical protein
MPSCEKCWRDAGCIAASKMTSKAEEYTKLITQRDKEGKTCTPEEQAGPEATICAICNRKTVHQYARICMNCGEIFNNHEEQNMGV